MLSGEKTIEIIKKKITFCLTRKKYLNSIKRENKKKIIKRNKLLIGKKKFTIKKKKFAKKIPAIILSDSIAL
jgi:hypothetical protein